VKASPNKQLVKDFASKGSGSCRSDYFEEKEKQLKGEISNLRDRLKNFYHKNKPGSGGTPVKGHSRNSSFSP